MMTIALADSVGAFFREVVHEAVRRQRVEATDEATVYLVALLTDLARPAPALEDTFDRPLTLLLDDALHQTGVERFQRLRALGDGALVLTGLFGEHIEMRGVDPEYVVNVGSSAYSAAAATLRVRGDPGTYPASDPSPPPNVFCELSRKFEQFVRVLTAVAEHALAEQARGERGVLKLYERWLRSGSDTLAAELGKRGIMPSRGPGGLH